MWTTNINSTVMSIRSSSGFLWFRINCSSESKSGRGFGENRIKVALFLSVSKFPCYSQFNTLYTTSLSSLLFHSISISDQQSWQGFDVAAAKVSLSLSVSFQRICWRRCMPCGVIVNVMDWTHMICLLSFCVLVGACSSRGQSRPVEAPRLSSQFDRKSRSNSLDVDFEERLKAVRR